MTERMPKITATAAGNWLDCPRRYRHKYVDHLPETGGPWAHFTLALAVHRALELWSREPVERRTPVVAVEHLGRGWSAQGYRDAEHAGEWYGHAHGWVWDYVAPRARVDVMAAERSLSRPYAGVIIGGRIDAIEQRAPEGPGALVVVDYKVGRRAPTEDDARGSYALAAYVWLTMQQWKRSRLWCTRAELHHLRTGEVVAVDYDRERMERQLGRLVDIAREIQVARDTVEAAPEAADEVFPTRTGPLCASCPFLDRCADGQARTGRAEPWAYLESAERDATDAAAAV